VWVVGGGGGGGGGGVRALECAKQTTGERSRGTLRPRMTGSSLCSRCLLHQQGGEAGLKRKRLRGPSAERSGRTESERAAQAGSTLSITGLQSCRSTGVEYHRAPLPPVVSF